MKNEHENNAGTAADQVPGTPTPPSRKIQPHQIALWLMIAFVILIILNFVLFAGLLLPKRGLLACSSILLPGTWLSLHSGLGEVGRMILQMAWGGFALYLVFYFPVKLWMTSSRHLHIALAAYVLLCFGTYGFYEWQTSHPDWKAYGLNPDRAGFAPQVVVLSGEFNSTWRDQIENRLRDNHAFFEIRMRGHDYYYCRLWHGDHWEPGSWFNTKIVVRGQGWNWGLSCSSMGTRGGGGSLEGDDNALLPGRRLWNNQTFTGARQDDLIVEHRQWPRNTEEFSGLEKAGRWLVPTRIHTTCEIESLVGYYHIKKIEFWPTPDTNWFEQVLAKYGPDHSKPFKMDLGEPGVAPGK